MKLRTLAALLPALLVASAAFAGYGLPEKKEELKLRMQPLVRRGRSDAPVTMDVELDWESKRLLEGYLDFTVRDGREVLGRYRSAEMALTPGSQGFRMMLPTMSMSGTERTTTVDAKFTGAKKMFPLGQHPIFLPSRGMRSLVVCVVQPGRRTGVTTHRIVQSLQLERFNPAKEEDAGPGTLVTNPVYLLPEDLPAYPIGFCSFDMIFLPADGLRALRSRQLDALIQWVRAGGSICAVSGDRMERHHADFINALAGDKGPAMVPSGKGGFALADAFRASALRTFHTGIGRSVLICGPQTWEKELETPDWRRAVAFLWKVRKSQIDSMAKTGRWTKRPQRQRRRRSFREEVNPPDRFTNVPIRLGDDFISSVLPKRIRLIPITLIGFILALFVVAVGLGDYSLLGILGRRQLTWVSFPLICFAFMLVTLGIARHYLGAADQQGAIVLVDIDEKGRVLRTNRVELVFAAAPKTIRREVRGGLYVSLQLDRFKEYGSWGDDTDLDYALPFFQGRIPTHFTAERPVKQWTPWCNRTSYIGGKEQVPALGWDKLSSDPSRTKAELVGNRRFDGIVLQFHEEASAVTVYGDLSKNPGDISGLSNILKRLCVRSTEGLFHVVSGISPNGGGNFEDLALLDSSDVHQRLIVAVTRRGNDYMVFRRLYQGAK